MIWMRHEFIQPVTYLPDSKDDNHTRYSWQQTTEDLLVPLDRDSALSMEVKFRYLPHSRHLLQSRTTAHAAAIVVKLTAGS